MESVVEALKAVGGGSRRSGASPDADSASSARVRGQSGGGSRQPDLDRQIEDQSKIRGTSAEGEPVQSGEILECQVPAVDMLGWWRMGVAVGEGRYNLFTS